MKSILVSPVSAKQWGAISDVGHAILSFTFSACWLVLCCAGHFNSPMLKKHLFYFHNITSAKRNINVLNILNPWSNGNEGAWCMQCTKIIQIIWNMRPGWSNTDGTWLAASCCDWTRPDRIWWIFSCVHLKWSYWQEVQYRIIYLPKRTAVALPKPVLI